MLQGPAVGVLSASSTKTEHENATTLACSVSEPNVMLEVALAIWVCQVGCACAQVSNLTRLCHNLSQADLAKNNA